MRAGSPSGDVGSDVGPGSGDPRSTDPDVPAESVPVEEAWDDEPAATGLSEEVIRARVASEALPLPDGHRLDGCSIPECHSEAAKPPQDPEPTVDGPRIVTDEANGPAEKGTRSLSGLPAALLALFALIFCAGLTAAFATSPEVISPESSAARYERERFAGKEMPGATVGEVGTRPVPMGWERL